jgi:hypothetical protein
MGKRIHLESDFKVAYVPLPEGMKEARRASLLLLLKWIKEDIAADNDKTDDDVLSNGQKTEVIKQVKNNKRAFIPGTG